MFFLDPLFPLFMLGTMLLAHYRPSGIAPVLLALAIDLAFMLLFLGPVQSAILTGFALVGYVGIRIAATQRAGALAFSISRIVRVIHK